MLSDRDRTLLAPHLALLRAAQKEAAAAKRAFAEAERQLAESTMGTDWRDRTFGGLFSIDDGRTQRYRQARDARKAAEKELGAAKIEYARYAERMDGLLEPILTREDPAFRRTLAAVDACEQAVILCEEMRYRLDAATAKPPPDRSGKRDSPSWVEAEFTRLRLQELIADLRLSVPALRRAIDRAALAVAETTGRAPSGRPELDTAALARFGRAGGQAAERHLRGLRRQVDTATKEISRWRSLADTARVAALRAAQKTL